MKIGPDGSLPRITSSSKDIVNNIRIVKVPDDQVKESEPLYKLVWIGAVENESESEKSDEELWSEEDIPNIQVPVENSNGKSKDAETKINDKFELNKSQNVQSVRRHNANKNNRYRKPRNQNNYNSDKRNFNSAKPYNNYNNSINNTSNRGNFARNHSMPIAKADNIPPWTTPPLAIPAFGYSQYSYVPVMDVRARNPPNSNVDNFESVGLLGSSPYCPHPSNFLTSNQNDNFVHGNNYWNNTEYHSNDYQRSGPAHMPSSRGHKNYYQSKNNWNRTPRNWPRKRRMRNTNAHFNYRN